MKKQLIIGSFIAFAGITNAQQWLGSSTSVNPIYRSGHVGIYTTAPNHPLDVRGNSSIGDGATLADFNWSTYPNERCQFITGPNGANGYGTLLLGSKDAPAVDQTLGFLMFGQRTAGTSFGSNDGLKACISAISKGSGGTTSGYGADMVFYTKPDNNAGSVLERMRIDRNGDVGVGTAAVVMTARLKSHITAQVATAFSADAVGTGFGAGSSLAVRGSARAALNNYGGFFSGQVGPNGTTAYGVRGELYLWNSGGVGYAVYGEAGATMGTGTGPVYAGYFNGDVVTPGGFYFFSDKRIKKDIVKINNSLNIISKLNPVNYSFDGEQNPSMALPAEKQYGFISQEIKEILPEFTKTIIHPAKLDEAGKEIYPAKEVLGLNYNGFIALLTKGMQEQQALIENQQKQLNKQKEMINALINKAGTSTGLNTINTVPDGFNLEQNIPNPFNNETVIGYTLPSQVKEASLVVYDLSGKQVSSFALTGKGKSSISLTSENLAAGIYIYSVIADGKIIDSKRMVVAQQH